MSKVVIAGGSGFLGRAIVAAFGAEGWDTVVLSRSSKPVSGTKTVSWDASGQGAWTAELNGADVVVNLSGETLLQKWTPKARQRIRDSRVKSSEAIGTAIQGLTEPPAVWINASAVGFYGDTGHREVSEAAMASNDTLGVLCREWEAAVMKFDLPKTSKTRLRIGVVLGREGGALGLWTKQTMVGLGGAMGSGRQFVPWIHVEDLARLIVWLSTERVEGAVNATAPNPVTNEDFMETLRARLGMPAGLPTPVFAARLVCSAMGWPESMLLGGSRVVPAVAMARGFQHKFPELDGALEDLVDDTPKAWIRAESVSA